MRPTYHGVCFYSPADLSVGHNLSKAQSILDTFDSSKNYTDVNEVLELYNITKFIKSETYFSSWTDEQIQLYISKCNSFLKICGSFFSKINDSNFINLWNSVCYHYCDSFLEALTKFKSIKNISSSSFCSFLNDPNTSLSQILRHQKLVRHFDSEITNFMRLSSQTAEILINYFMQDSSPSFYLPQGLSPFEYDQIFQTYLENQDSTQRPSYLYLLSVWNSVPSCPISDKTKLHAKRAYKNFWNSSAKLQTCSHQACLHQCFQISCADLNVPFKFEQPAPFHYHLIYDSNWLLENKDYPTILNNFIFVFEYFDLQFRSHLPLKQTKTDALERAFRTVGKNDYPINESFYREKAISSLQMSLYYDILQSMKIRIEDVFKWFFEEYLLNEFNASGFIFNSPSLNSSYLEKCRHICSEMDSVLKQFSMFVKNGEIDRELFELESSHIVFKNIPSFCTFKYAYKKSENIDRFSFFLFSNQSALGYIEGKETQYDTLFDLLCNETILFDNFLDWQKRSISYLVDNQILLRNGNDEIQLNSKIVPILKDLYENEVLCLNYKKTYLTIINQLILNDYLEIQNTLFTVPEQKYMNYILNRSEFGNSLDLRNKYIHGTHSTDEKVQKNDYIELLKLMILIIVKINEEFCLRDSNQGG